jgi:3-phosphoinositide dependent protein kinase-1
MVTGMPPFVSQSEYLIFQKIQAKDYTFPEGFDPAARDLVTRLLELAPADRPDCAAIKAHGFLAGVDWAGLHRSVPPGVPDRFIADPAATDPVWERQPDIQPGLGAEEMSRLLRGQIEEPEESEDDEPELDSASCTSEGSCLPESGNIGDISDGERERLLGLQRATNEYHALVEGRLILKQGILDKKKGLLSRVTRMFLLTEGPRLFYVDPKDKSLKGEIPWSNDMKTEMKDFR